MASRRLVYEFFGLDAGASATFDKMEGNLARGAGSWSKFAKTGALAVAAVAVYAVKSAAAFQKSTELIHTQAGRSQADVDAMRKGILAMAGSVGTGPMALSDALFHIASTGLSARRSMDELRIAAEGAKIGNADLTDVTNALNATVVSGIRGAGNFAHAMGALNAIVGAGDMHMQDLSDALGSGVLAVMKTFGVSLNQAGAALATFGDNNIRGAQAATYLRQAVQSISDPSSKADKALAQIGVTTDQLKNSLAKGGLSGALDLLHSHFANSGIAANKWGDVLEQAFTKKAGIGITLLLSQFGRYQVKQQEVADGAKNFGNDWSATTKNLSFQMDRLRADVEVLAVKIGDDLLPVAMDFLKVLFGVGNAVGDVVGWFKKHEVATAALAAVIGGALIPRLLAMGAAFAVDTLSSFANGLAAVTLRLIGTRSALGEVNDEAGLMAGAFNPLTAIIAVAGAATFIMWERDRKAAAAAKQGVDDYVAALHVVPNDLGTVSNAITQLTGRLDDQIRSGKILQGGIYGISGRLAEYQNQLGSLRSTQATVTANTRAMGREYGLTNQQVQQVADAAGIQLTGALSAVDAAFGQAVKTARLSHHPNQQAAADFKDMTSNATTLSAAITDLSNAWDNYIGAFTGLKEQQDSFNAGLRTLRQELKKSGGSLRDNGGAATKARDSFLSLVDQIGQVTSATYKSSAQQDRAVAAATRMRNSLKGLGASGPLVRAELQKLDNFIASFKNTLSAQGSQTGQAYDQGLIQGLNHLKGQVVGTAAYIAGQIDIAGRGARGVNASSPSKKGIKTGQDYGKGLAQGLSSSKKWVTVAAEQVASLLDEGMQHGWTGMATRIKNALGTNIQNALTSFTDHLAKELTRQQALLSNAESRYKSLEKARNSAIASLSSSIGGSADISNVLNQTDANGNPFTGNVATFLSSSIGQLQAEAAGLAKLRKMGLSQALLSQISALAPTDAVTIINQILSGQDGSVASLNQMESTIRSIAKQSASVVVRSPHEREQLKAAKDAVFWAHLGVSEQRITNRHLARIAAHAIAGGVTVNINGRSTRISNADGVEIIKVLRRLARQGITV